MEQRYEVLLFGTFPWILCFVTTTGLSLGFYRTARFFPPSQTFFVCRLVFNPLIMDLMKKWNTPTGELINISLDESWSRKSCWSVVSQAAVVRRNNSGAIKPTATDVNVVKKEKRKHSRQTLASCDVGHSSAAAGGPFTHSRCSSLGHIQGRNATEHVWSFSTPAAASVRCGWDDIFCLSRLKWNLLSLRLSRHHHYEYKSTPFAGEGRAC